MQDCPPKACGYPILSTKFYRQHAVIGDVEIFMHAAMNPTADGEAERARRNDAGFRRERTVGKEDARRVIGDSSPFSNSHRSPLA
jgi:hypothetical protein